MKSSLPLWFLRGLFILILVSMVMVAGWASLACPLFAIPSAVLAHPWFITTLMDAYWAFITFFVWVAWKERGGLARVLWFMAVVLLGNMAMAAYFLRELWSIRTADEIGLVFTRRNPGHTLLAGVLTVAAVGVYLVAWNS